MLGGRLGCRILGFGFRALGFLDLGHKGLWHEVFVSVPKRVASLGIAEGERLQRLHPLQ